MKQTTTTILGWLLNFTLASSAFANFDALEDLFINQTRVPTMEELMKVAGWHSGRCYQKAKPDVALGSLLGIRIIRNGDPRIKFFETEDNPNATFYDNIAGKENAIKNYLDTYFNQMEDADFADAQGAYSRWTNETFYLRIDNDMLLVRYYVDNQQVDICTYIKQVK